MDRGAAYAILYAYRPAVFTHSTMTWYGARTMQCVLSIANVYLSFT